MGSWFSSSVDQEDKRRMVEYIQNQFDIYDQSNVKFHFPENEYNYEYVLNLLTEIKEELKYIETEIRRNQPIIQYNSKGERKRTLHFVVVIRKKKF